MTMIKRPLVLLMMFTMMSCSRSHVAVYTLEAKHYRYFVVNENMKESKYLKVDVDGRMRRLDGILTGTKTLIDIQSTDVGGAVEVSLLASVESSNSPAGPGNMTKYIMKLPVNDQSFYVVTIHPDDTASLSEYTPLSRKNYFIEEN